MRTHCFIIGIFLSFFISLDSFSQQGEIILNGPRVTYTKMMAETAKLGGRLSIKQKNEQIQTGSNTTGILLLTTNNQSDTDHLTKVHNLIMKGGRAIIFVDQYIATQHGQLFIDLFGVMPVREHVVSQIYMNNENYLPYFGDGQIGIRNITNEPSVFCPLYIETISTPIERATIKSDATGKERNTSVKLRIGNGEVIITVAANNIYPLVSDEMFDTYNNPTIIRNMLTWLLGN